MEPRVVRLIVPAGVVDAALEGLVYCLSRGDIIRQELLLLDDVDRAHQLAGHQLHYGERHEGCMHTPTAHGILKQPRR